LHAGLGVPVYHPWVARRGPHWVMDPHQFLAVWPAFRRDVLERGRPVEDREVGEHGICAWVLGERRRKWLGRARNDKAVSGLDPSTAEICFAGRDIETTCPCKNAEVVE
jgi:hypothetical protein